jgi:endonuclease/exonuclease/phosphatase family metal-dependent hydrolase
MSITRHEQDLTRLLRQSYNDNRARSIFLYDTLAFYDAQNSTRIYAIYENNTHVFIGVHGVQLEKANTAFLALLSDKFFNNAENNLILKQFCEVLQRANNDTREVIVCGHSLGANLISRCESETPTKNIKGVFFAPYADNIYSAATNFMAQTSRYKKIFYRNDIASAALLKMPTLNNAVILTPRTNPMTFINSHTLDIFMVPLARLLADLKTVKKPIKPIQEETKKDKPDEKEKKEKQQKTNIKIFSYNVKMFPSIALDERPQFRAKEIIKHIDNYDADIIAFQELFDDNALNIITHHLNRQGYHNTKRVGSNFDLLHSKLLNGGIILFSRLPFTDEKQIIFKEGAKEDQHAAKGAIKINVIKNDIPITIIATHLQSGKSEQLFNIKKSQLQQIDGLTEGNLTLMVGDFNWRPTQQLKNTVNKHDWKLINAPGSTTNNNFSDTPKSNNALDHLFIKETDNVTASGNINIIQNMRVPNGYQLDSKAESSIIKGAKELERKFVNLFSKKKKKRDRYTAFQLSDHFPIFINVGVVRSSSPTL